MSETIQAPALDMAPVEKAAAVRQAAADRLASATAQLKKAEAAATAATAAVVRGVGDPMMLAKNERRANDDLAFHQRVVGICEHQHNDAIKKQSDAYGAAYQPVHDAGVAIRLAASATADAARAQLAEAEAEFRRGTALIERAREKGYDGVKFDGSILHSAVHSVVYEKAIWGISA